ncbi:MAG: ribbon-helix-helix protein, CopG family [Gemmatimonadota bacterium]|nr:ribbon-helix-helix protein, CopG family [Gemmatimonadota bacterium]
MKKVTFTLDDSAVRELERAATRLDIPKSQVVREALELYGEHLGRLSDEERDRMLARFDRVTEALPDRPREELDADLEALRASRRRRGRRTDPEGGA